MIKRGLLLLIILLINGCNDTVEINCSRGGCSNHLCVEEGTAKDLFTTCEFLEEYNCLKFSECGYFDGECKWKDTPEYSSCLEGVRV